MAEADDRDVTLFNLSSYAFDTHAFCNKPAAPRPDPSPRLVGTSVGGAR